MATRSARILSLPQGPDSRLLQHRHQICCLAVFWTSHRNILCPLDIPKQMPINEVNSINYPRLGFIGLGDWVRLVDSLIPITSKQWSQQKTQQFDWGFPHDIKPQNEWKWLNLPWICHDFCDLIFCFFFGFLGPQSPQQHPARPWCPPPVPPWMASWLVLQKQLPARRQVAKSSLVIHKSCRRMVNYTIIQ